MYTNEFMLGEDGALKGLVNTSMTTQCEVSGIELW